MPQAKENAGCQGLSAPCLCITLTSAPQNPGLYIGHSVYPRIYTFQSWVFSSQTWVPPQVERVILSTGWRLHWTGAMEEQPSNRAETLWVICDLVMALGVGVQKDPYMVGQHFVYCVDVVSVYSIAGAKPAESWVLVGSWYCYFYGPSLASYFVNSHLPHLLVFLIKIWWQIARQEVEWGTFRGRNALWKGNPKWGSPVQHGEKQTYRDQKRGEKEIHAAGWKARIVKSI